MLISFVVVLFLNANTTSSHQGTSRFGHLAKGLRLKSLVKSASRRSCRLDWLGPSIRPEDASNGWPTLGRVAPCRLSLDVKPNLAMMMATLLIVDLGQI